MNREDVRNNRNNELYFYVDLRLQVAGNFDKENGGEKVVAMGILRGEREARLVASSKSCEL